MSAYEAFRSLRSTPAKTRTDDRSEVITELVQREAGSLLDYFRRRTTSPEDAADLFGETLLVIWRRERAIPDDPTRARMWMFGVATKVLSSQRRSTQRRSALTERLVAELHTRPVSPDGPDIVAIRELIDQLSGLDQEIIRLVYWDGFTITEAATILSMHPGTARSRLSRARSALRDTVRSSDG